MTVEFTPPEAKNILDNYAPSRTTYTSFPPEINREGADYPQIWFSVIDYPEFVTIKDDQGQISEVGLTKNFKNNNGVVPVDKSSAKILDRIVLAAPQNVSNAQGIGWEMNNNPVIGTIKDFIAGDKSTLTQLKNRAVEAAGNLAAGVLVGNAFQSFTGASMNPKKQALFSAPEPRAFTFDFIFTPMSEREANTIDAIIKKFTKYSLPTVIAGGALFQFPKEFLIEFRNVKGFPEIDACVCTSIVTNYTPNALQLLKDGHSIQTTLSLTFLETTLRTSEFPGVSK